jgi:hypothetical protein
MHLYPCTGFWEITVQLCPLAARLFLPEREAQVTGMSLARPRVMWECSPQVKMTVYI